MLGQFPRKHAFRGSIPFTVWAASPVHSSSLPFCVRFNEAVTSHAATLDTGLRARSYPGGSRTHLSMKHFQFAPDPHVRWCGGWAGQPARLPDFGLTWPLAVQGSLRGDLLMAAADTSRTTFLIVCQLSR